MAEAKQSDQPRDPSDIYVRLPDKFWTKGWIHALSGSAVAMLLILLDTRGGSPADRELWFSGRVAEERYALTEETRGKGIAELVTFELVLARQTRVRTSQLGSPRLRNVYTLRLEVLDTDPWDHFEP